MSKVIPDPQDIDFKKGVTRIIKYKRGNTYYMLKQLTRTPTMYDKYTSKPTFRVMLYFVHGFNSSNYCYEFKDDELFSDRFEMVDWDKIDRHDRVKIADYHGLEDEVNSHYQNIRNDYLSAHDIDSRVQEIGEVGGSHKPWEQRQNNVHDALDFFKDTGNIIIDGTSSGDSFTISGTASEGVMDHLDAMVGATYEAFYGKEEKSYEEPIEPIVVKRKEKKRKKTIALKVDRAKILK